MANEQDIIVRLKAEGTKAFINNVKAAGDSVGKVGDEVEETEKKVEKSTDKMSSSFKKVGGVIAAAFATAQIGAFIKESVKLADIQLKAEAQLLKGLKGRADIQKRLIAQAKQLQKETTFGDEAIIAQQAYLANLEFTEKQIKDIIKASVDLSAGANIPLESSVRNLAKSYSGLSGELGELIPQLRDLTQDQLKNGEGVKVITELYEGQASVLRNTGTGAVKALSNAVGDLQEEFGKSLIEGVQPLALGLKKIAENEAVIGLFKRLGNVLGGLVGTIGAVVSSLGDILSLIPGIGKEIDELQEKVKPVGQTILEGFLDAEKGIIGFNDASQEFIKNISQATTTDLRAVADFLEQELQAALVNANAEAQNGNDIFAEIARNSAKQYQSALDEINKRLIASKKVTGEVTEKTNKLQDVLDVSTIDRPFDEYLTRIEEKLKELNKEFVKVTSIAEEFQQTLLEGTGLQISDSTKALIDGVNAETEALKQRNFETQQSNLLEEERKAKAIESFNEISKLQSGAFDIFAARQQAELQLLDNRFQNGLISEKEYEKERRNIQRKQAKADKAQAIFQATINTAAAITSALIKGPAFIAIAAALGAAQIAAIAKTPIPKFAKGTRLVGDGYELGEDRTLAWLNKGERVIAAQDNKKKFALYNAIEENDTNRIMLELAKQGIAVQFNGGLMMDDLNKPLKSLADIKGNAKKNGIDLNPLLTASDRQRVTLARKLDLLNNNVSRLGNSLGRVMTKA